MSEPSPAPIKAGIRSIAQPRQPPRREQRGEQGHAGSARRALACASTARRAKVADASKDLPVIAIYLAFAWHPLKARGLSVACQVVVIARAPRLLSISVVAGLRAKSDRARRGTPVTYRARSCGCRACDPAHCPPYRRHGAAEGQPRYMTHVAGRLRNAIAARVDLRRAARAALCGGGLRWRSDRRSAFTSRWVAGAMA